LYEDKKKIVTPLDQTAGDDTCEKTKKMIAWCSFVGTCHFVSDKG